MPIPTLDALWHVRPDPETERRFRERALAEGLVDVAYVTLDSPLGPLLAAATEGGLVTLSYLAENDEDAVLQRLATHLSPRIVLAPRRLDRIARELDEYFGRRRRTFELEIDLSLINSLLGGFSRKVLAETVQIPYGEHASYSELARCAGSPRAARAAGNALGSNPIPIVIPCHRVLPATGRLGNYTGGIQRKRALLELEGTELVPG